MNMNINTEFDEEFREIKNTSLYQKSQHDTDRSNKNKDEGKPNNQLDNEKKKTNDQNNSKKQPLSSKCIYYTLMMFLSESIVQLGMAANITSLFVITISNEHNFNWKGSDKDRNQAIL